MRYINADPRHHVAIGLAIVAGVLGCGLEESLPSDISADVWYAFEHKTDFLPATTDEAPAPGVVRDALTELAGCWASYLPGAGASGSSAAITVWRVEAAEITEMGLLVLSGAGGLFEVGEYFDGVATLDVLGDDRIRLTFEARRFYDPLKREYVETAAHYSTDYLATLDEDTLYLYEIDGNGNTAAEPDIVLKRFQCAD